MTGDTDDQQERGGVLSADRAFNILFGIILSIIAWFSLTVWGDGRKTQEELNQLALTVSRDYVRRDDLTEIKAQLSRIEEKVDQKADKAR